MKLLNKNTLEIKKSTFIALHYEVFSIDEVNTILNNLQKEYKKARHIPYAFKINSIAKKSDDKEPKNTAGAPIFFVIDKNNLNNSAIFIVRIYGGIKLGAGPLTRAYSKSASLVIKNVDNV